MMEKIRSFFTKNFGLKILAVVLGIAVWIIIFNIQDPQTTVYVNVPIEYINENLLLTKKGRVFLSGPSTVSVAVTVNTSQSDKVDASFFSCTADLTATTGADIERQSLRTEVTQVGGQGVILDWAYTRGDPFVTIALDEYFSKQFSVNVKWENKEVEGMQVRTIRFDPETVTISGAKSKFTNVSAVKVPLTLSEVARNLTNGIYDGNMPIRIYDVNDTPIANITDFMLSTEFVKVHAEIDNLASVPLVLSGTPNGSPAEGYYYNGATVSLENVTLLSLSDITVDAITIPLSDIDINGLTAPADFTIDLSRYAPDGVSISEETAVVHVGISANSTMTVSFYSVIMDNGNQTIFNYTLRNRPSITVSGTAAAIAGVTEEVFRARVNVAGLAAGVYNVPVSVTLPEGVSLIGSNLTAEIQITYVETAPPETTTEEPTTEEPTEQTTDEPEDETTESGDETTESGDGTSEPVDETTEAGTSAPETSEAPSEAETTESVSEAPETEAPAESSSESEEQGGEEQTEAP